MSWLVQPRQKSVVIGPTTTNAAGAHAPAGASEPGATAAPARLGWRAVCRGGGHGAAGAPVLSVCPGQELLVDQIAAQRGVVGVQHAQKIVDLALWVPQAGLECLGDL